MFHDYNFAGFILSWNQYFNQHRYVLPVSIAIPQAKYRKRLNLGSNYL